MALDPEILNRLAPFIKAHHKHLTVPDIAVEMGVEQRIVTLVCNRLNITCCSIKNQRINFIVEKHEVMTLIQLANALQIPKSLVLDFCNALDIRPKKEEQLKPDQTIPQPTLSVARILSQFQMPEAGHFNDRFAAIYTAFSKLK